MRGTRKRIWLLIAMVSLLMLALGAAAAASTGQDGPSPAELGDPVNGTQVVPHGGYSSSTNFCMQCHDVHDALGSYALMATASVEATCSTCHSVYAGGTSQPGGGPDPGGGTPVNALGTVSLRTAYDNVSPTATHGLGDPSIPGGGNITQSDWDYGTWKYPAAPGSVKPGDTDASTPAGIGTSDGPPYGLYCATCHAPHGEYGQMVNNWTSADEGTGLAGDPAAIQYDFGVGWTDAWLDIDGGGYWYVCPADTDPVPGAGVGVACQDASVQDSEAQEVSLFGYKLLSAYPNHTYSVEQSYMVDTYNHDGALWCSSCHVANDPGSIHNHQTGCSACHGNPVGDPASADFPHTSTADRFLIDYPDALCISCHTPGSLP